MAVPGMGGAGRRDSLLKRYHSDVHPREEKVFRVHLNRQHSMSRKIVGVTSIEGIHKIHNPTFTHLHSSTQGRNVQFLLHLDVSLL